MQQKRQKLVVIDKCEQCPFIGYEILPGPDPRAPDAELLPLDEFTEELVVQVKCTMFDKDIGCLNVINGAADNDIPEWCGLYDNDTRVEEAK
jgi:hypothetical protein